MVWTSGGNKYAILYDDGDREDGVTKVIQYGREGLHVAADATNATITLTLATTLSSALVVTLTLALALAILPLPRI